MLLRAMPSTSICSVCGRRRAARDTTTCPKCMTKYADTSSVHSTTQRNNSARSAQGQDRRQGGAVPAATSKAVGERAVAAAAAAAESPQCVRLPRSQLLEKFHNGQLPGRPSREWGLFSLYHFFCGELLQEQRSPATSSQVGLYCVRVRVCVRACVRACVRVWVCVGTQRRAHTQTRQSAACALAIISINQAQRFMIVCVHAVGPPIRSCCHC